MWRSACGRFVGSCRFRRHRRDASGRLGPRASGGSAGNPKHSISSRSRRQQRFPRALLQDKRRTVRSGRQRPCARSVGSWAKTTCRPTLIDPDTGRCSDGLHPDRPNENKGAELALAYLLGLVEIRRFKRTAATGRMKPLSKSEPMRRSSACILNNPREPLCRNPIS